MARTLLALRTAKHPAARIVCFPYAGGNAAFPRSWAVHLPVDTELLGVRYPGRHPESRIAELRTVQEIAETTVDDILQLEDAPLILFGYSLGALVAYESSVRLAARRATAPFELVVAAARAPHLPRRNSAISHLSDDDFIERLRNYGGTSDAVLQDREMMEHFLPLLRADFATAENYRYTALRPLTCRVTAIGGTRDPLVDVGALAHWEAHSTAGFQLHHIDGGHFFLHEQPHAVLSIIRQIVARQAASQRSEIRPDARD